MKALRTHLQGVQELMNHGVRVMDVALPLRGASTADLVADAVERERVRDVLLDLVVPIGALEGARCEVAQRLDDQAARLRTRLASRARVRARSERAAR